MFEFMPKMFDLFTSLFGCCAAAQDEDPQPVMSQPVININNYYSSSVAPNEQCSTSVQLGSKNVSDNGSQSFYIDTKYEENNVDSLFDLTPTHLFETPKKIAKKDLSADFLHQRKISYDEVVKKNASCDIGTPETNFSSCNIFNAGSLTPRNEEEWSFNLDDRDFSDLPSPISPNTIVSDFDDRDEGVYSAMDRCRTSITDLITPKDNIFGNQIGSAEITTEAICTFGLKNGESSALCSCDIYDHA
ncbi:MAG: hypothetical protein AB8B67_01775 [Rickettsiaceae bacterium]